MREGYIEKVKDGAGAEGGLDSESAEKGLWLF